MAVSLNGGLLLILCKIVSLHPPRQRQSMLVLLVFMLLVGLELPSLLTNFIQLSLSSFSPKNKINFLSLIHFFCLYLGTMQLRKLAFLQVSLHKFLSTGKALVQMGQKFKKVFKKSTKFKL